MPAKKTDMATKPYAHEDVRSVYKLIECVVRSDDFLSKKIDKDTIISALTFRACHFPMKGSKDAIIAAVINEVSRSEGVPPFLADLEETHKTPGPNPTTDETKEKKTGEKEEKATGSGAGEEFKPELPTGVDEGFKNGIARWVVPALFLGQGRVGLALRARIRAELVLEL